MSAVYRVREFPRPEVEAGACPGMFHAKWLWEATFEVDEHVRVVKRAQLRHLLADSESRRQRRRWSDERAALAA